MSDEELDRAWVPNGRRPQSTIARSFSQELMDIFRIENSISDLDQQVDQRKQAVGKTTDELASLEARLKAMDEMLNRNKTPGANVSRPAIPTNTDSKDVPPPPPAKDGEDASKARSRPGTARAAQQAPSSGNMPPTPGGSEGEYYLVTKADLDDRAR